jgi:hypothetical protein
MRVADLTRISVLELLADCPAPGAIRSALLARRCELERRAVDAELADACDDAAAFAAALEFAYPAGAIDDGDDERGPAFVRVETLAAYRWRMLERWLGVASFVAFVVVAPFALVALAVL